MKIKTLFYRDVYVGVLHSSRGEKKYMNTILKYTILKYIRLQTLLRVLFTKKMLTVVWNGRFENTTATNTKVLGTIKKKKLKVAFILRRIFIKKNFGQKLIKLFLMYIDFH